MSDAARKASIAWWREFCARTIPDVAPDPEMPWNRRARKNEKLLEGKGDAWRVLPSDVHRRPIGQRKLNRDYAADWLCTRMRPGDWVPTKTLYALGERAGYSRGAMDWAMHKKCDAKCFGYPQVGHRRLKDKL